MNTSAIIWCGSILNHEGLQRYRGEAPSASQWSRGLLNGITNNGVEVVGFAPIWDSLFPRGRLFPGDKSCLDASFSQNVIRYVNFPFLRTDTVALSLERSILKELDKGIKPLAILNYNAYPHYCKALKTVIKKYPDIPWVNVILDQDDPVKDNWLKFLSSTQGSKASVFLSWWGYNNAPILNKLHLDSGWSGLFPDLKDHSEKVFIYAGKISDNGGINDIIEAIKIFPRADIKFHFYGKGAHAGLNNLALTDNRVSIFGFVTDQELDNACRKATAFFSPRDLNPQETRMIFPSKLLFYLRYKKPVLSPMLPGLSPDYSRLLIQPDGQTSLDWSQSIEKVIEMSNSELNTLSEAIEHFLLAKTWQKQAKRLIDFLEFIQ